MTRAASGRDFAAAWIIATAFIIYGSLYPFEFRVPASGAGALRTLLGSWDNRPGRGDLLSNILLYVPFGFFGVLAVLKTRGTAGGAAGHAALIVALIAALGAGLSIAIELAQYFDAGRDTQATDVYTNAAGTALGALAGCLARAYLRWPSSGRVAANRFPALLLAAWVTYRLYPFVPTIDLHKYWHALRPIILHAGMTPYDLYRHSVVWLTLGTLVEAIAGRRRFRLLFALFVGGVLVARVFVLEAILSEAEVAGAGLALLLAAAFGAHRRTWTVAMLLGCYVVALRLEPFQFHLPPGHFEPIPFLSFLRGSVEVNLRSFLEKFFLYGSLVWLLAAGGLRIRASAAIAAAMLLLTSLAETCLPGRSAEVTDAVMALLAGVILGSLKRDGAAWNADMGAAEAPTRAG